MLIGPSRTTSEQLPTCKGRRTEYGRYHGGVEGNGARVFMRTLPVALRALACIQLVGVLLAALATESEADADTRVNSVADLYGLVQVECECESGADSDAGREGEGKSGER